MVRRIWTIGGFVMGAIGYGGIRGDLEGWAKYLHLDNLGIDFWWNLLLGVGIALLIANLIPPSWWRKLFNRLPLFVRDKIRFPSIASDKVTGFYCTRHSMNEKRGGILKELDESKEIWACWHAGTNTENFTEVQRQKIKRLILRNPNNSELATYAEMWGWDNLDDVVSDIKRTSRTFKKTAEVRWFNGSFPSITIGNPNTNSAWARVEVFFYSESAKWQSYLVYYRDNKKAYNTIKNAFENMWNSKFIGIPEGTEGA